MLIFTGKILSRLIVLAVALSSPLDNRDNPVRKGSPMTGDTGLLQPSKPKLSFGSEEYCDKVNAAREPLRISISCGTAQCPATNSASEAVDLRKDERLNGHCPINRSAKKLNKKHLTELKSSKGEQEK